MLFRSVLLDDYPPNKYEKALWKRTFIYLCTKQSMSQEMNWLHEKRKKISTPSHYQPWHIKEMEKRSVDITRHEHINFPWRRTMERRTAEAEGFSAEYSAAVSRLISRLVRRK